jgi:hypothetical protein
MTRVVDLRHENSALALGGDLEAARVATDAIARLLDAGTTSAPVVDLASARRRR